MVVVVPNHTKDHLRRPRCPFVIVHVVVNTDILVHVCRAVAPSLLPCFHPRMAACQRKNMTHDPMGTGNDGVVSGQNENAKVRFGKRFRFQGVKTPVNVIRTCIY